MVYLAHTDVFGACVKEGAFYLWLPSCGGRHWGGHVTRVEGGGKKMMNSQPLD